MREIIDFLAVIWKFLTRHGRIFWLGGGVLVGMLFNILPVIMMIMGGFGMNTGMPKFPVAVELSVVKQQPMSDTAMVTGSLGAEAGVVLRSEVQGRVTAVPLAEGSQAEAGNVLIVLDDKATTAQLNEARARARVATRNLARLADLRKEDSGLVAQKDYDSALAEQDVSLAAVKVAEAAYAKTHITAPFAGTVGIKKVHVGDYVTPGQELVSLQAMDALKVDFALPERFAAIVAPGQNVDVRVDALGGEQVSATVVAVDPLVNAGTREVNVQARLDNVDGRLRPGMFVRVGATLDERSLALTIPEEAIVPEGDAKYVYKIIDKKAVKTAVSLGMRTPGTVEVTSGLKADDLVVVGGQIKLSDGSDVVATNMTLPDTVSATTPTAKK